MGKYQVRVCPYMSSSTLRAISNTGFLFLFSTCSKKSLEGGQLVVGGWFCRTTTESQSEVTQHLASTGTPPEKCKWRWRQNPSAAGDTALAPQSSPNTEKTMQKESNPKQVDLRLFHISQEDKITHLTCVQQTCNYFTGAAAGRKHHTVFFGLHNQLKK